jgi:hypothetical protein
VSILIICPSRGRPQYLEKMIASFVKTSSVAHLVVRIDDDQKEMYASTKLSNRVFMDCGPRIGPGGSINGSAYVSMRMAKERNNLTLRPYEAFCAAPDDAEFVTPGWDTYALETIRSFPGRIGVVSAAHDQGTFLNYPCVSKEWIEVLGWYAHPTIYHFCWDTMHELLGDATNIVYAPRDKWLMDHQGLPQNMTNYQSDTSSFLTWCITERPQTVKRLRAAIARANG